MLCASSEGKIFRTSLVALAGIFAFGFCGRAAESAAAVDRAIVAALSPEAEPVAALLDAWRLAEAYVACHPGCDAVVGSGDSMLPLYRDRTVLVVRTVEASELRRGMTAVFIGDQGRPVAHVLIEKTPRGWRAMGLGNREPDRTRVGYRNLIGVVVKAYAPDPDAARLAAADCAERGSTETATTRPRPSTAVFAALTETRAGSAAQ